MISLPDDVDTLGRDLPNDSDSNSRAWEWVTHNQVFRDTQLSTKFPGFVLELHIDRLGTTLLSLYHPIKLKKC